VSTLPTLRCRGRNDAWNFPSFSTISGSGRSRRASGDAGSIHVSRAKRHHCHEYHAENATATSVQAIIRARRLN
jgi:hypothetical protein